MSSLPYTIIILVITLLVTSTTALPAITTPCMRNATLTTPTSTLVDVYYSTPSTPTPTPTATGEMHILPLAARASQDPPPYKPVVTAPPEQDAELASLGYYQTTYYTCNTIGGNEHCGWHVPVLQISGADGRRGGVWSLVMAVLVWMIL